MIAWYKNPGHGSTSESADYGDTRLRATIYTLRDRSWTHRWEYQITYMPRRGTPQLLTKSAVCFRTKRLAKTCAVDKMIELASLARYAEAAFFILFGGSEAGLTVEVRP